MNDRKQLKNSKRWVVKVGSALLTDNGKALNTQLINGWAKQIALLRDNGIEVVLVSSGSVAAGMQRLGWSKRPEQVNDLQAAAAIGQAELVKTYDQAFTKHDITTAQVLLTHADMANRQRYLNARSTLRQLLELGVLSIINENDTVATDEIRFGDNDNLAALVANLLEADLLVLLTDQQGLYSANPAIDKDAELIWEAQASDESLLAMASGGSELGRGGMVTKLTAAQTAARSGASTIIAHGRENNVLHRLFQGEQLGTLLKANQTTVASRKQWLAGQMQVSGVLTLDDGAVNVLQQSGRSLLPVGITKVNGSFERGELVSCVDVNGKEIARGLVNYKKEEAEKIIGKASSKIIEILKYGGDEEMIHRDNLVLS